jgi:hypothetical protein
MSAPSITICPRAPQQVFFDEHVGMKTHYAVAAHSTAGGNFASTGLSFDDYFRMGTEKHKLFSGRRTTVPLWAVNDHDLQRVLVAYLEARAYGGGHKFFRVGTLLERIARAEKRLIECAPRESRRIDDLCARYVEMQRNGGTPRELATLQKAIKGLDTNLIINRSPARILAAIIYKYFRQGFKANQIGADLGLDAPCVRQILFRIQKVARALGYPEPERITSYPVEPKYKAPRKPGSGRFKRTPEHIAALAAGRARAAAQRKAACSESGSVENAQAL